MLAGLLAKCWHKRNSNSWNFSWQWVRYEQTCLLIFYTGKLRNPQLVQIAPNGPLNYEQIHRSDNCDQPYQSSYLLLHRGGLFRSVLMFCFALTACGLIETFSWVKGVKSFNWRCSASDLSQALPPPPPYPSPQHFYRRLLLRIPLHLQWPR